MSNAYFRQYTKFCYDEPSRITFIPDESTFLPDRYTDNVERRLVFMKSDGTTEATDRMQGPLPEDVTRIKVPPMTKFYHASRVTDNMTDRYRWHTPVPGTKEYLWVTYRAVQSQDDPFAPSITRPVTYQDPEYKGRAMPLPRGIPFALPYYKVHQRKRNFLPVLL